MNKFILLIILAASCSFNATAQKLNGKRISLNNKADVDLRSEFSEVIRDQGDIGFCYAHSTADMLSFWLNTRLGFKEGDRDTRIEKNMVSGLGVAIMNNTNKRLDLIDDIHEADFFENKNNTKTELNAINPKLAEQLQQELSDYYNGRSAKMKEPEGGYLFLPENICFESEIPSSKYTKPIKTVFQELYTSKNVETVMADLESIFPDVTGDQLKEEFDDVDSEDALQLLSTYPSTNCKKTSDLLKDNMPRLASTKNDLFQVIDSVLDEQKPVFIIYDSKIYRYSTSKLAGMQIRGSHTSTIVGRLYRPDYDEPLYIVRNTWGNKSCLKNYKKFIMNTREFKMRWLEVFDPVRDQSNAKYLKEKLYDKEQNNYKTIVPYECDDLGYYLVKKSHLQKGLFSVSYFF